MENLVFGLEVMIIGFAVVMFTLYLLYLILIGFSRVLAAKPIKTKPVQERTATISSVAIQEAVTAPVAAAISQHQVAQTAPEIVVAITAAISAYLNKPTAQLEIVSVDLVPANVNSSDWLNAGRRRLMDKRQDCYMFRRERR